MSGEVTRMTYEALYRLLASWLHGGIPEGVSFDWEALFSAAKKHSLTAAVCMALEGTGQMDRCPAEIAVCFREAKIRSLRKTLLMDAEREKLLAFMEENGIWYMPLKGVVLERIYPQLGAREFSDNDILFDAEYFRTVREYMRHEGYMVKDIRGGSHNACLKPPFYNFEMHQRLFSDDGERAFLHTAADYYADVRKRLIKDTGNNFGYHFRDEDFYVYFLVHAFKHYERSGTGLRTLLDIYLYRLQKTDLDERYITAELSELGILAFEVRCRTLAEKLFGLMLSAEELTVEEREALDWFEESGIYGTMSHYVQKELQWLQMRREGGPVSVWTRGRFLLRKVFPDMNWYKVNETFAYRHPWTVPFFWLRRLFRGLFINGHHNFRMLLEVCTLPEGQNLFLQAAGKLKWYILRPFQIPASRQPMEKCVILAMQIYEKFEGHTFDLSHPVLFTEKQVWYKLFFEHPDLVSIHDKYLFKDYIEKKLGPGYTAPLYGMWTDVRDLKRDWDSLPDTFCLKSNCSYAGRNIRIIRDKNSVDRRTLFREVRRWLNPMNTCINTSYRVYRDTTPRIMAEKLLLGENGQLDDYKVYCFDGRPDMISVVSDRFSDKDGGKFGYYDLSWRLLPVTKQGHAGAEVQRPRQLDEMLRLAERLSEGFPFMRVDFYVSDGRVLVGELTPFSGNHFDQWEFDRELGKKFILPGEEHNDPGNL